MKDFFQKAVLVLGGIYIFYLALPWFWHDLYDQQTLDALSWFGYGGKLDVYGVIPYVFACGFLVSLVGLHQFKKWGRAGFMLVTVISGLSSPLWGLQVSGYIDSLPSFFVSTGSGALIAISYFSSISAEFE